MADNLDDCEFWLPPQFLTDDDFKQSNENEGNKCSGRDFHQEFSYGFGAFGSNSTSGLSSPVESVVGSTETESDEDEYITGLTRKMANSTLEENCYGYEKTKGCDFSGSPKSPLCKHGLRSSSPRSHSQVSSHAGLNQNEWNLLCMAAEEVARMKMVDDSAVFYPTRNVPMVPRKPSPVSVQPFENHGSNVGFLPNQSQFAYQQLQAARFEQLKRQQQMLQQQKAMGGCGHFFQVNPNHQQMTHQGNGARRGAAGLPMSAWPTLQQSHPTQPQQQQPHSQPGSGMRAVFLGNPGAKSERAGTGVFLPRRIGSPTETRKNRQACATVLLPDRVVQALNLNLEKMDSQPQVLQPRCNPDYDAAMKYRKNMLLAQQRQQQQQQHSNLMMRPSLPQSVINQEVQLPQEWTY